MRRPPSPIQDKQGGASHQLVEVGIFGAPHGVRGELRLKSFTAYPATIADYAPLTSEDGKRSFKIKSLRPIKGDMLVVSIEGIADRDAAETLTNLRLFVPRDQLPPPDEEEYYHADLIGLKVENANGLAIGYVTAVHDFGAGDILDITLDRGGPSVLLPFTKAAVPEINLQEGRLIAVIPEESDDKAADALDHADQ
jgi:16S rRNA processing protein RimM